jgi:hypothetical protein
LTRGYLSIGSVDIQTKITDGVISEREGRKQVYELEVKYKEVLQGVLAESLAVAKARGDDKAVLSIQQQIQETQRLAHVIDTTREKARGIFTDATTHGLDELTGGLKHAAATFGLDLANSIRHAANVNVSTGIGKILFGKNDEFGSESGIIGKALKKLGLGDLIGGTKGADSHTVAVTNNTRSEDRNTIALNKLTATIGAGGKFSGGFGGDASQSIDDVAGNVGDISSTLHEAGHTLDTVNVSVLNSGAATVSAVHEMTQTMIDLQPKQMGLLGQILVGALGVVGSAFGASVTAGGGSHGGASIGAGGKGGLFAGPYVSGFRATGGPVKAGELYGVNEREPEFFRPNASGEVIPLSKLGSHHGGAHTVHNHYYQQKTVTINQHFGNRSDTIRTPAGAREFTEQLKRALR